MLFTAGRAVESLSVEQLFAESFVVWMQFSDDKLSFRPSELAECEPKALAFNCDVGNLARLIFLIPSVNITRLSFDSLLIAPLLHCHRNLCASRFEMCEPAVLRALVYDQLITAARVSEVRADVGSLPG